VKDSINVQYLGFQAKPEVRKYMFQVRSADAEREFILNIANDAFLTHRVKYQDAPTICSQRLHAELAANANYPTETEYTITTAELDTYRASRAEKTNRSATVHRPSS
jgi:hypothetical protein